MDPTLLLIVLLTVSVIVAFGIGANNESLAPLVSSGAVKLKYVLYLGFIISILGALLFGTAVSETIGSGLLNVDIIDATKLENLMLAVIISTSIFLILSSTKGLPISTTVGVVGAVIGVGIYYFIVVGVDVVLWGGFTSVVMGWIISPLAGLAASMGIYWLIRRYILTIPKGLRGIERMEQFFLYGLVGMIIVSALTRTGNDVGNAVGVLTGFQGINLPNITILLLIGGIGIGIGLYILGRRVLQNVGKNILEMRPSDAFAIQTSVSIILLISTTLGAPISGTALLIFAIIGNSVVKHLRMNKKTMKDILLSWGLTIPVTLLMAMGICALLYLINPIPIP
jgi:PiT family inorganic phosphate transporter